MKKIFFIICLLNTTAGLIAQKQNWQADSWQDVQLKKGGTITALWYDIEPFIYVDKEKNLTGVEYEIMEAFKNFVIEKYHFKLKVDWVNAGSFENIYSEIRDSKKSGLTGWSYFSITDERKKEIKFTPPYMTDLNVLVTNNAQPFFTTSQEFTGKLNDMKAYTMQYTTMEEDVNTLKNNFYKSLQIDNRADDYNVMTEIAEDKKGFGYIPLSVYIVGLQKGIKVKRQNILTNKREGFAGVMPMSSDWQPVWNEFFQFQATKRTVANIISKYLGSEVGDLVITASSADSSNLYNSNMELLSLEKEIVTQRMVDAALDAQQQKTIRNILIALGAIFLLISAILYNRFKVKQKLTNSLQQRNLLVAEQNEQIEKMNHQLNIKILQSKLNPHFLFNSLNSIQYFINENDRKGALQYIQRFSKFLRRLLQSSDELLIPAHEEAELLQQYLWLEQNRFPGRFVFSIMVDENVKSENVVMPPLLSHSLVEEALYLSVLNDETAKAYFIKIHFKLKDDRLIIEVINNGIARKEALNIQQAKGLQRNEEQAFEERLELINKKSAKPVEVQYSWYKEAADDINSSTLNIPQT